MQLARLPALETELEQLRAERVQWEAERRQLTGSSSYISFENENAISAILIDDEQQPVGDEAAGEAAGTPTQDTVTQAPGDTAAENAAGDTTAEEAFANERNSLEEEILRQKAEVHLSAPPCYQLIHAYPARSKRFY